MANENYILLTGKTAMTYIVIETVRCDYTQNRRFTDFGLKLLYDYFGVEATKKAITMAENCSTAKFLRLKNSDRFIFHMISKPNTKLVSMKSGVSKAMDEHETAILICLIMDKLEYHDVDETEFTNMLKPLSEYINNRQI